MFKKKTSFEKIDSYLSKKGYDLIMSLFLENYNNYYLYIRFDYVKTIQAYKITWIDMDFINYKHPENYINTQIMTRNMGIKLDRLLGSIDTENTYLEDDNILGDRVEIVFNNKFGYKEYTFSRFLPNELKSLFDPIIIVFTYLPRSMEVILEEMLAKYSGGEEYYNHLKPIKFNLKKDKIDDIFRKDVIERGKKYYEEGHVTFLEKIDNKYVALVSGDKPYLVIIEEIDEDFTLIRCTCPCEYYCKHEYATLLAIKEKKFNNFYKVRFIGKEETLLERIRNGAYSICCGVENDSLLIITNDNEIVKMPIILNGKKCFEVIEDDDDKSLSEYLKKF
jgi:hypothetical protein